MRINSAGALFVGTTTVPATSNTTGFRVDDSGYISLTGAGTAAIDANRMGSDGQIINLRKDGTTVGSIGAKTGDMYLGTGASGLYFFDATTSVIPWNAGANSTSDAAVDLGHSAYRFKDIKLSGGVVFGDAGGNAGTSNNSNTLDSYEEGTWTPNGTGVSAPNGAYYTKIGRQVRCHGYIESTATIITLGGLPFDIAGGAAGRAGGSAVWNNYATSVMGILLAPSGVNFAFYVGQTLQQITTGKALYFELTYITNA